MPTTVVLDTSALVANLGVVDAYPGAQVVVPLTALEELDGLKRRPDDTGRSARQAVRRIWAIIEGPDDRSKINAGVPLPGGGSLRVEINGHHEDLLARHRLSLALPDNRILNTALGMRGPEGVRLVSNDVLARVKSVVLGLDAEEAAAAPSAVAGGAGHAEMSVPEAVVDALHDARRVGAVVSWDYLDAEVEDAVRAVEPNGYLELSAGPSHTALARVTAAGLRPVSYHRPGGLRGRSSEQHAALDLLMDPAVPVVAISGRAGTGKTLLALAAGLAQTSGAGDVPRAGQERRSGARYRPEDPAAYDRLMILRPLYAVGRQDLGYLPGGLEDKLGPWMEAVVDAMAALSPAPEAPGAGVDHAAARGRIEALVASGKLSLDAVTFLRGRSLRASCVVVDEAQNLEIPVLKTILTRVGEGTKVVFLGDTSQIDNPYAGESSNALAYLVERFSGQSVFGHLELTKGERSEVASLAAGLL